MLLTLEVISANGDVLGGNRRKTVGPEGAQIGRSKESDWVINDQYISRIHARVRYVNGAFYVEGLGRNPLALNDPEQTIPNNEPQLLRNGDRFFLDQYEIRASLSTGHMDLGAAGQGTPAQIVGDPFAGEPARSTVPQAWDGGIVDGEAAADSANLDPLAALGGSAPRKQTPLPPVNIHQGSVLEDSFRAPSPISPVSPAPVASAPIIPTPAGAGGKIPDAWDRSGFTQMGQQPPSPAPPPRRPAPAAPPPRISNPSVANPAVADSTDDSIPDTWDKSRITRLDQPPPAWAPAAKAPPRVPPQSPGLVPEPAHQTVEKPRQPAPSPAPSQAPSHTMRRPADPVAAPQARPSVEPAAAVQAGGSLNLEELLQAAGVPATQMSPEMARELGQVLRIVVQGVMEVLQSRAEIKSQLRMSMTRMQASENNPLKFSPNVEAALHTLLVERNRGYLPTTRAFQEALTDIRNHQIAVLQGIRTAFDSMLEHFDPEKLEAEMERQSKRGGGLLNLGGKGRFRDHYVEQFENMTKDPDESFRRLFGEYFAQAYEEQMDALKAAARTSGGQ